MGEAAKVYHHSGKMGAAPIVVPLVAVPLTLALAWVYGYVCVYNPLAGIVSVLIPLFYGGGVAAVIYSPAQLSHCRNRTLLVLLAVPIAALALYAGWAAFLSTLLWRYAPSGTATPGMFELMADPVGMNTLMNKVNASGWFTIKNMTPSGGFLGVCWIIEALIITVIAVVAPAMLLGSSVYCERCRNWCAEKKNIARFAVPPMREDIQRIKDGDLAALAEMANESGGQTPYLRLDTQRCEKCSETATFQVVHVTREMKEGKLEESEDEWTKHVLLNPQSLAAFQEVLVRRAQMGVAQPTPEAAPSAPESAPPASPTA